MTLQSTATSASPGSVVVNASSSSQQQQKTALDATLRNVKSEPDMIQNKQTTHHKKKQKKGGIVKQDVCASGARALPSDGATSSLGAGAGGTSVDLPQPQMNQKDTIKHHIRLHLEKLIQCNKQDDVINVSQLRDTIIPLVKKKLTLSYSVGPKLFWDFSKEVNEEYFDNKFTFHYHSNSYRARGGKLKKSLPQHDLKIDASAAPVIITSSPSSASHDLQQLLASGVVVSKQEHHKLQKQYQSLLKSYTDMNEKHTKERNLLHQQILSHGKERQQLVESLALLTKEANTLKQQLALLNSSDDPQSKKRKRADYELAAQPSSLMHAPPGMPPNHSFFSISAEATPTVLSLEPTSGFVGENLSTTISAFCGGHSDGKKDGSPRQQKDLCIVLTDSLTSETKRIPWACTSNASQSSSITVPIGRFQQPRDISVHIENTETLQCSNIQNFSVVDLNRMQGAANAASLFQQHQQNQTNSVMPGAPSLTDDMFQEYLKMDSSEDHDADSPLFSHSSQNLRQKHFF
uniref:Uncharacterized protein n=1 Tax=Percolomonas cosmopolitus TaxID=63605 RepID=A0A7S1KN89_9EUKA|mmetsp:Transcript_2032/g.7286  ORF Transcript_2032/g.7286 Transcript_2032/m.7286 type:complete len:519 (+) Transcript_2032:136-1692(+)